MIKQETTYKECLENFPLRVSITDYCCLNCFFCSNEGMPHCQKNLNHINLPGFKYLTSTLYRDGLQSLSITGGEPTVSPQIMAIIKFLNRFRFANLFFHTNGVNLNKEILNALSINFTKLAISIHSVNFNTWEKLTTGTRSQFERLMNNINLVSKFENKFLVELKYIPLKGLNDSKEEIIDFLDFCNSFGFRFKFLNFEPIKTSHEKMLIPIEELRRKLLGLGCQLAEDDIDFRGQDKYLPIRKMTYKSIEGVLIEIGCGSPSVCRHCYKSNEIFINPKLEIKPCHMHDKTIPLLESIRNKNNNAIAQAIVESRLFLKSLPGRGKIFWGEHN